MLSRAAIRQSRRALFTTPPTAIGGQIQIARRAFLSTESTTTSIPSSQTAPPPPPSQRQESTAARPDRAANSESADAAQRQQWGAKKEISDEIARNFIVKKTVHRKTKRLGSTIEDRYVPQELINHPPTPKDVTLELLLASQTHMGHNTAMWNPENSRYIHGIRNGIHIISLEQTALHLRRAARVVEEIAYNSGLILFVGTRRGQSDIVVRAAELAGGCHIFDKWNPGTITNRDVMLKGASIRMVDEQDRDISDEGFRPHLMDHRALAPDLVIVLNPLENHVLLRECAQEAIPTIGIIDTDADAARVTYPIPANDDSLRSAALIAGVLGQAGKLGNKRRLRDAKDGLVTWENDTDVLGYLDKQSRQGEQKRPRKTPRWILAGGKFS
ncbi:hypothetical protein Sste5346_001207 [Sporothrix stenoceras]|uniref:Uncharacterized protein n=1 Tax=Sporothrix stenoceras TaxID=5173 RepID=A0ABR3ZQ61_9PEZI